MFEIGVSELAVIGVTALLVVGPERLPGLARVAGLYVGRARRLVHQVRAEIQRELDDQDLQAIRQIVRQGAGDPAASPAAAPDGPPPGTRVATQPGSTRAERERDPPLASNDEPS